MGTKVNEKIVTEKVTEAIAAGEIDNSRVVKDEDEDKESIVEKDQIEAMETSPLENKIAEQDFDKDEDEDEEEIELQRIKDDDDDDNQHPEPDIGNKIMEEEKEVNETVEPKLPLEKESITKVTYTHVKTPDEVDDLPEHEVVATDENVIKELQTDESEEKILQDEKEKEDVEKIVDEDEKSEESIEALRSNEIVEVAVEQKQIMTPDEANDQEEEGLEKETEENSKLSPRKEMDDKQIKEKESKDSVQKEVKPTYISIENVDALENEAKEAVKGIEDQSKDKNNIVSLPSVETEDLESKQTVSVSIEEDISEKENEKEKTTETKTNDLMNDLAEEESQRRHNEVKTTEKNELQVKEMSVLNASDELDNKVDKDGKESSIEPSIQSAEPKEKLESNEVASTDEKCETETMEKESVIEKETKKSISEQGTKEKDEAREDTANCKISTIAQQEEVKDSDDNFKNKISEEKTFEDVDTKEKNHADDEDQKIEPIKDIIKQDDSSKE